MSSPSESFDDLIARLNALVQRTVDKLAPSGYVWVGDELRVSVDVCPDEVYASCIEAGSDFWEAVPSWEGGVGMTATLIHRSDCTRPEVRLVGRGPGYLGPSYHKCLTCEATDLTKKAEGK